MSGVWAKPRKTLTTLNNIEWLSGWLNKYTNTRSLEILSGWLNNISNDDLMMRSIFGRQFIM